MKVVFNVVGRGFFTGLWVLGLDHLTSHFQDYGFKSGGVGAGLYPENPRPLN